MQKRRTPGALTILLFMSMLYRGNKIKWIGLKVLKLFTVNHSPKDSLILCRPKTESVCFSTTQNMVASSSKSQAEQSKPDSITSANATQPKCCNRKSQIEHESEWKHVHNKHDPI